MQATCGAKLLSAKNPTIEAHDLSDLLPSQETSTSYFSQLASVHIPHDLICDASSCSQLPNQIRICFMPLDLPLYNPLSKGWRASFTMLRPVVPARHLFSRYRRSRSIFGVLPPRNVLFESKATARHFTKWRNPSS